MADGRKKNGGPRKGAGRKPKADEVKLIERLTPMDDEAIKQLRTGLESGDFRYLRLFFEYRYGKPLERKDITTDGQRINQITVSILTDADPITSEDDITDDI